MDANADTDTDRDEDQPERPDTFRYGAEVCAVVKGTLGNRYTDRRETIRAAAERARELATQAGRAIGSTDDEDLVRFRRAVEQLSAAFEEAAAVTSPAGCRRGQ